MRQRMRLLAGLFVIGLVLCGLGSLPAEKEEQAAEGYQLPTDKAGTLLAKVLPPRDLPLPVREVTASRPAPEALTPALPTPTGNSPLPRVPVGRKPTRLEPHLLSSEPVPGAVGAVPLPGAQVLSTGDRVKTAGVDVNRPIPLPISGQPTVDRASLEDPTAEVSAGAAIAAPLPGRGGPLPFQRLTRPNPFENRKPVTTTAPPPEESNPAGGAPLPPRP